MIVVADTSVILNLGCVEQAQLLQQLFGRVVIPTDVASEFDRLVSVERRFGGRTLPSWIEVQPVIPPLPAAVTVANLDRGEAAAIALCLNLAADALLIDESLGRAVASRLGLRTIGILGILLEARRRGLISRVSTILNRLRDEAGFWIAPTLRDHVLRQAGE